MQKMNKAKNKNTGWKILFSAPGLIFALIANVI